MCKPVPSWASEYYTIEVRSSFGCRKEILNQLMSCSQWLRIVELSDKYYKRSPPQPPSNHNSTFNLPVRHKLDPETVYDIASLETVNCIQVHLWIQSCIALLNHLAEKRARHLPPITNCNEIRLWWLRLPWLTCELKFNPPCLPWINPISTTLWRSPSHKLLPTWDFAIFNGTHNVISS